MALEKFSSQADPELLQEIKLIAQQEGKKLHAIVNEALSDLVEKRKHGRARTFVMEQFQASLTEYDSVFKKLAQ